MSNKMLTRLHFYHTEDRAIQVTLVNRDSWDVWLSLDEMVKLFGSDTLTISNHIQNLIAEDGLDESSVVAKIATPTTDGKKHPVNYYNLDVILPVGYRVHSPEANRFRKWANDILRDYLRDGVAINQPRLESLSDEVLARVASTTITRIVNTYRKRGFSDDKIRSRLNGIVSRNDFTDALKERVRDEIQYGTITNITYKGLFGRRNYELEAQNGGLAPRDGMTSQALDILSAAETSATQLINGHKYLYQYQAFSVMDDVCRQLKPAIEGLQKMLGIDLATSQPLDPPDDDSAA